MDTTFWTGDPVEDIEDIEDIEVAKALVARHPDIDLPGLIATAANRAAPHSARIAATWCLGFVDDADRSSATLSKTAEDEGEPPDLRDHAVEALASVLPGGND